VISANAGTNITNNYIHISTSNSDKRPYFLDGKSQISS
jgi:hypothetical protein